MYSTSEFRNGLKIEIDGDPYIITWFQAVNPGKGSAFTRTKLKNLITGSVLERTYKSGEKVKKPDLEENNMQFLYHDGSNFVFMNTETYEQVNIPDDVIGDDRDFLKENLEVAILFFNGKPVGCQFPNHVVMKITYCEPGLKGDTATGATKTATMESGMLIQVPLFINEGDDLKIDTRTRAYLGRVNS